MDRDLIRFHGKVLSVAERQFYASFAGSEAESFVDGIYNDYKQAGKPEDVEAWLTSRLRGEFLWVSEPPRWVEDEPSWPFLAGRPMVFIKQTNLPKNDVTEGHLTWDAELYLFGSRVDLNRGYRVEYRVVTQIAGIHGEGDR